VGHYRLQYLSGSSGDLVHVREFEAESDEAAIGYADEVRSLSYMELWEGQRRLKTWDAVPPMVPE
jgi:hypothetical protein